MTTCSDDTCPTSSDGARGTYNLIHKEKSPANYRHTRREKRYVVVTCTAYDCGFWTLTKRCHKRFSGCFILHQYYIQLGREHDIIQTSEHGIILWQPPHRDAGTEPVSINALPNYANTVSMTQPTAKINELDR